MAHPLAGQPPPPSVLIDIPKLISDYYLLYPDCSNVSERVSFGTSGHRGSAFRRSFNEAHIYAMTQAVCDYRKENGIDGALFLGYDTHALSLPAFRSALEVLAANGVKTRIAAKDEFTPTPLISRAILQYKQDTGQKADGIVITPSHNPPEDGGFKYNLDNGGPADTKTTSWIERRANDYLSQGLKGVRRVDFESALASKSIERYDFIGEYVKRLGEIIDMEAIKRERIRIGADPLGGSALPVYEAIRDYWGLDLSLLNSRIDPTFSFMRLDHDGKIRMDCSSPWVIRSLEEYRGNFDLIVANDADADRHGIISKEGGLMNPNHYLSVAVGYLSQYRTWGDEKLFGKTLVSSSMIDHVARSYGRGVYEVPVGFKWFVQGLISSELCFGGEESAGASFLCFDAKAWSTDKDGIVMALLAAEIMAKTGKDPAKIYAEYEERFGKAYYRRIDAKANQELKARLKSLKPQDLEIKSLGGEEIVSIYTKAPGNHASIGGIKILTQNAWIAMRPSGTEDIYKIYAESFISQEHLERLLSEAQAVVDRLKD